MRVAFVSMHTAQRAPSRSTERTRQLAERLVGRGHDVTVCCAQWWGGEHGEFEQNGVTYRAVTADFAPRVFASRLPFVLRGAHPDVVHAVPRPPGAVSAAKTAGRFLRTPVVVDWLGFREEEADGYRRAARAPDVVVTPSELIRTQVRERGAAEEDVVVIPESIDASLVRETPADDRADIVFARRLDADANVESFLLALAELRTQGWRAAVIGDGPRREEAEAMAADLRIADRVDFLGELSDEERVGVLKGAHVFAHTATFEPFATDLLWALACGCVGVVEYQAESSAHELVQGKPRGACVTSPQELASEIEAAADRPRREVDDAYASYDHRAILDRYVECYRDAIDDFGFF